MSFNLSCTAQDLNTAVTKANAAAPQSTTYTKAETNTLLNGKQNTITTIIDTGTATNSTDITDTGVTVDIPVDGGIYEISACAEWGGSPPSEIQIRMTYGTRTSNYLLSRSTAENNDNKNYTYLSTVCAIKPTARYPDEDNTHHVSVWTKSAAASGNNSITLIARKISD